MKVKIDTPHLGVDRYMPSSAYVTAYVAAGWIGCDSATSEAF